jgi:dephospho-CoA kinase
MKIFIIGSGECGKTEAKEIIVSMTGLRAADSSWFMAEKVVRPYLENKYKIKYQTIEECYQDRRNYRELWLNAISEYNELDSATLAREIFKEHDIYAGIRSRREFLAAKEFSDLSIWIDAEKRVPKKDLSLDILKEDCDMIIDNNGTLKDFRSRVLRFCRFLCA